MSHLLTVLRAFRPLAGQAVAATLLDIAQRGGIVVSQDESTGKLMLRLHRDKLPELTSIEHLLVSRIFAARTEYGPVLRRVELYDVDARLKDAAIHIGYLRRLNEGLFALAFFGIAGAMLATFAGLAAADDPSPEVGIAVLVLALAAFALLGAARKYLTAPTDTAEPALNDTFAANPDSLFFKIISMDIDAIRAWVEAQPAQPAWWQAHWPPATDSARVAESIRNFAVECEFAIVTHRRPDHVLGGGGDGGGR